MRLFERSVRVLCLLSFAGDPEKQREVAAITSEVAREGRVRQIRELGGLASLALHQTCRSASGDNSGLARSAASLAAPAAFYVVASSLGTTLDATSGVAWFGVVLLALAGVASACRNRPLTLTLALLATGPAVASAGPAITVALSIAIAASVASPPRRRQPKVPSLARVYLVLGLFVGLCVLAGLPLLSDGPVRVATIVIASTLIVFGLFDPRYALVAAVVFGCRFATFDLVGLAEALGSLGRDLTIDELVVRWLAMTAGLIASLLTARRSIARSWMI